jgi:hypothetical protein
MPDQELPKEQKSLELNIFLHPDNSIEVKGLAVENEPISFWMLDKAHDMIKMHHINKMMQASQDKKIIGAQNFRGFINRVRGK